MTERELLVSAVLHVDPDAVIEECPSPEMPDRLLVGVPTAQGSIRNFFVKDIQDVLYMKRCLDLSRSFTRIYNPPLTF